MPKSTLIFYPAPGVPLSRDEIQHIFAKFAPGDDVMVALRQILAERLAASTGDNIDPRLDQRAAGMVAGRMQEISAMQTELDGLLKGGEQLRRQRVVEKAK